MTRGHAFAGLVWCSHGVRAAGFEQNSGDGDKNKYKPGHFVEICLLGGPKIEILSN